MEKASERRAEQRLHYRWPVRFFIDNKEEALPGQMFDLSSTAMMFLCNSDSKCPQQGQQITIRFSAPYFNEKDSFDTVLFDRIATVRRVDKPTEFVNRVAADFIEPLFFKPGEQDIDESDAQQRLQAKAVSIVKAEEKIKAYGRALTEAEEKIRAYAQNKAKLEETLRAEIENKYRIETELRVETQQKLTNQLEKAVKAQERAKNETKARIRAEANAKREAKLREKADKKAKVEDDKIAKIQAEAREKTVFYTEQINNLKADFARTIAAIKEDVDKTISQIVAKCNQGPDNKNALKDTLRTKEALLKKLNKFVTDRNKLY